MTPRTIRTWQGVRGEVLRRIAARHWAPGDLLPTEAALAAEFGCARTTVNRALRALAEAGYLDRRRKAGTRVAVHPVRSAVLKIPVMRHEIEARGQSFGYALLSHEVLAPPAAPRARLGLARGQRALHLTALTLADGKPYVFEDRWINTAALPAALTADFAASSANEWLVTNAPFSGGDFSFAAIGAGAREAAVLGCGAGDALFVAERVTWAGQETITSARLVFAPGYRMTMRA